MSKKRSILLIILGILLSSTIAIYFYQKYQKQEDWIYIEASLIQIENTEPFAQGGKNPDGYQYFGIYTGANKTSVFQLQSPPASQESLVNAKEVFYVNPNDYNEYHLAYSKYSWLRGLAFLIVSIIGFISLLINKINKK